VTDRSRDHGRRPSGTFAIRLAKAAGASVESILSGSLGGASRCKACEHRLGDGAGGVR